MARIRSAKGPFINSLLALTNIEQDLEITSDKRSSTSGTIISNQLHNMPP